MSRVEHLSDDVTLMLGDCRELLGGIGKVDALVTDPPYGIGIAQNPVRQRHEKLDWDASPPSRALIETMVGMAVNSILWGGNYFGLPPTQRFLIWDKLQPENFSLAMCEQAWTNLSGPAKMYRHSVTGYEKSHPTQKPVGLMVWCLGFIPDAETILDPFMGSGTTGVACVQAGRKFIGIEREEAYFETACPRISDELRRPRLDLTPIVKPVQEVMSL